MKKLNKAQLRKIILQEMHDLEEAKLGGRAEAFLKDKVKFGGAAAKALNYLMGTGFFEEMMKEVEGKLSQTLTPDAILRVKMAMKDYIDFELGDIDMGPALGDSDGISLEADGVEVDAVATSFTLTDLSQIIFASEGNPFYGKLKQLIVYKEALTDAELSCITS